MSFDQDAQGGIAAQAHLAASKPEDTRVAGPEHVDSRSAAQAELFKAMHVAAMAGNATYRGGFAGLQGFEGNSFVDH